MQLTQAYTNRLEVAEVGAQVANMLAASDIKNIWGSCLAIALLLALSSSGVFACSAPQKKTSDEIFRESTIVFRGVAISAELIKLPLTVDVPADLPIIEVHWQVNEIFKGFGFAKNSAVTQYFCGGVQVVVGQPYIFSLVPLDDADSNQQLFSNYPDLKWALFDPGTIGAWEQPAKYESLLRDFRRLKR